MKTVKDTLLDRRSIRRYERQPISKEQLNLIYQAIRNTPTSYNGQQFCVIDISDQQIKEQIYDLTGQKQIKTCSHFMLFCIDYHKIAVAAKLKGEEMPPFPSTADGLIVGVVDASLAMMSALTVAESLGLGTCPIGYARTAAPEELSRLMRLPQGVFVICGLALRVPREQPDMKPKQQESLIIHHEHYCDENIAEGVTTYDKEITDYTASRSGNVKIHDWTGNILSYYREAMNYHILDALRSQGFDIIK